MSISGNDIIAMVTGGVLETDQDAVVVTDTLGSSPAGIIGSYLIVVLSLVTTGGDDGDWPLFISSLPDKPNNAVAICDTPAVKDGRYMNGSPLFHYGIEIMLRSRNYQSAWDKLETIALNLDNVKNAELIKDEITYTIHNVSRPSNVTYLGPEQGTSRRYLFSINFITTIGS